MMELEITDSHADVRCAGRLAGRYHHRDAHKPYVHPLNTPMGHTVSLACPHDHRHHRALMYTLRARDCNFVQEHTHEGSQRHLGFEDATATGEEVGFTERLSWWSWNEGCELFRENRTIACRHEPARRAFVWRWRIALEAQRDAELIPADSGKPDASGKRISYHGMCLRLRRDFAGPPAWYELYGDGAHEAPERLHGAKVRRLAWIGRIDGTLPVERAGAALTQEQSHTAFLVNENFAYMAMGPTATMPVSLTAGETIEEAYEIEVFDVEPVSR